jgi:hypothetical protein
MKRISCAVLSVLLWACGPDSLPEPSIVSVVPEKVAQGDTSALSVKVSAVLPFSVDYGDQTAEPLQSALTVQVAGQAVDVPFASADGTLIVPVPEHLALGDYDIRVALADGRNVERERAFAVVLPSTMIGLPGDKDAPRPEQKVSFQIDPIGDQVRDVPFRVTVRALGPEPQDFRAPVTLQVSHGQVRTVTSGTFEQGVRQEEISLSHPGNHVYLMIEDAAGNRALSNPFRVRPH